MNSKVKYSKDLLENIAKESISVAEVIRKLGLKQAGGTHAHIARRLAKYNIDISHFRGKASNHGNIHEGGPLKLNAAQIFQFDRLNGRREHTFKLRRGLIESGIEEKCECGIGVTWNNKPITLQIDHIDGNGLNNLMENLRFLCPNCHSQTETFCSKNRVKN